MLQMLLIGMLAVGIVATLLMNLHSRSEFRRHQSRLKLEVDELRSSLSAEREKCSSVAVRVRDLEDARSQSGGGSAFHTPTGMNWTKRTQALRMSRRGDSPPTISAALAIPECELRLLLKIENSAVA